jgi:hypothetical protein
MAFPAVRRIGTVGPLLASISTTSPRGSAMIVPNDMSSTLLINAPRADSGLTQINKKKHTPNSGGRSDDRAMDVNRCYTYWVPKKTKK